MLLPDILDKEKSQIRELAKEYAISIWKIPFNEGLILFVKTNNELHKHPARWKFCLKCGEIDKKEKMDDHRCLEEVEDFPVLIQTSWVQLKKFFLSNRYKKLMKDAGIDKIPVSTILVESKIAQQDVSEETLSTAIEEESS
jgi:hypothetical protein